MYSFKVRYCIYSVRVRYCIYSVRIRYCISSHTPFFSHTINISNDQTLILDITGGRRRHGQTFKAKPRFK